MQAYQFPSWLDLMIDRQQGVECVVSGKPIPVHISDMFLPDGHLNPAAPAPRLSHLLITVKGPGRVTVSAALTFVYSVPDNQDVTPLVNLIKKHLRSWLKAWLL